MELTDGVIRVIEDLEEDLMWWEDYGCEQCPDDLVDNCDIGWRQHKERAACLSKKEEALRTEIERLRETGQLADSEELEAKHGQGRLF